MANTHWLPHKIHFQVHRRLRQFDKFIIGADSADAPLCGSIIRVTDPNSVGTEPSTALNPLGTASIPAKMTTNRREVTCKRCLAMLEKMKWAS